MRVLVALQFLTRGRHPGPPGDVRGRQVEECVALHRTIMGESAWRWTLRPHPGWPPMRRMQRPWPENWVGDDGIVLNAPHAVLQPECNLEPLDVALSRCDVIVSHSSTTALVAAQQHVPILFYGDTAATVFAALITTGAARVVPVDGLGEAIRALHRVHD